LLLPESQVIKFIDVKEWHAGDYIWDVGTILHNLLVAAPVEREGDGSASLEGSQLTYTFTIPEVYQRVATDVLDRIKDFATSLGDLTWNRRLELSIASNLLGLPEGRLRRGMTTSALICFGEGVRRLSDFAS